MVDVPILDLSSVVCYYKTINYPFLKVNSPTLIASPIEQATHTNNGCSKSSSGAVQVEITPTRNEKLAIKDSSQLITTPTSSNLNSRGNDPPVDIKDITVRSVPLNSLAKCAKADKHSSPYLPSTAAGTTSFTRNETNFSKDESQTKYILLAVNHPGIQYDRTRQTLERKTDKDSNKALAPVRIVLPKNGMHDSHNLHAAITPDTAAVKKLKDKTSVNVPASGKRILDSSFQHSLIQEHCCRFCGALFHRKDEYDVHLDTHTGSRGTQKGRSDSSATKGQMRRHQCHFCSASFARKYRLTIHIRTHTGEKPYKCDLCAKSFKDSDHLRRHARTHTGSKPHKCHLCIRQFSDKEHLKRHLNVHYSGGRVRQ